MNWKFRYNLGSLSIFFLILNISLFTSVVIKTESITTETAITKIAFDETHDPSWETGYTISYGVFKNTLSLYHDVTTLTSVINEAVLSEIDILIIVASQTPYTTNEINIIEEWIRSGGSILLISDYQEITGAALMGIASRFDFVQKYDALNDNDDFVEHESWIVFSGDNINSHEITVDVSRIEIYGGGGMIATPSVEGHLVKTDSDGTASWDNGGTANNIPIACVLDNSTYSNGRIAIFTDGNFLSGYDQDYDGTVNFFDSDNSILALNTISWLADKEYGPYSPKPTPTNTSNLSYAFHVVVFFTIVSSLLLNIANNFRRKKIVIVK